MHSQQHGPCHNALNMVHRRHQFKVMISRKDQLEIKGLKKACIHLNMNMSYDLMLS